METLLIVIVVIVVIICGFLIGPLGCIIDILLIGFLLATWEEDKPYQAQNVEEQLSNDSEDSGNNQD